MTRSKFALLALAAVVAAGTTATACTSDDGIRKDAIGATQTPLVPVALQPDVAEGFAFNAAHHLPFGLVLSWSIGENNLAPDLRVNQPDLSGSGKALPVPAVAVLENLSWSGSAADPITWSARVSPANAQSLALLGMQNLTNATSKVTIVAFAWDAAHQVYVPSFRTLAPTGGTTTAAAVFGRLASSPTVGTKAMTDVPGVANRQVKVAMSPVTSGPAQRILFQQSSTAPLIQTWGLP